MSRPWGPKRGVSKCPQPKCRGTGRVEDTDSLNTWYVRRTRGCDHCGFVWSTAEIPLTAIKRIVKVETFIRDLGKQNAIVS